MGEFSSAVKQYKDLLENEQIYAAICSILVVVEAGEFQRSSRPQKDRTAEQKIFREELARIDALLFTHSEKTWAYWRSIAGIAHLVELGELESYPTYYFEELAKEMRAAFEQFLPLESDSIFGTENH